MQAHAIRIGLCLVLQKRILLTRLDPKLDNFIQGQATHPVAHKHVDDLLFTTVTITLDRPSKLPGT